MKRLLILFAIGTLAVTAAYAQDDAYYMGDQSTVAVQAPEPPPALPNYVQPPCPADGYLWNPGYWAWGAGGYYWVPGVWVLPPAVGLLWTPGYWGFYGGYYGWHRGYWGPQIGYYGGINYGFGYFGVGFVGGRWEAGHFMYNTAVWHVDNRVIHNVYVSREGIRPIVTRASFNGPRGVSYRPSAGEEAVMRASHTAKTPEQEGHERAMSSEKGQFARPNNGRPAVHSMSKPGGQRYDQKGRPAASHSASRGGGGGGGKR